jgi:hypothetical protein
MSSIGDLLFAIALEQGRYTHRLSLCRHHAQVYSQNGEDGIIAEIFRRIGDRNRFFVEIGTENGLQNNTRFLLEQGWSGVWIDANFGEARDIFAEFVSSSVLTLVETKVTAENINSLLDEHSVPTNFDFLSVDIDQNTSHVWRVLARHARVSCIEYNASLPPMAAVEVPYEPDASWDGTNWFGAGLKVLERIGAEKCVSLVACELAGVNAFFVDAQEATGRFQEPFTAEMHWEPPRYEVAGHLGHPASRISRRWSNA